MTRGPAPLAGIVLAGGASRRMGRDKATLTLGGTTLVERVVSVVGQRCAPVFVMAAAGQALPELPAEVLRDEVPGAGPLPATGRGLRAAADAGAGSAFVCAVDMPWLTATVIDTLATAAAGSAADVVLAYHGRDHYLAAVYRTELAERIDALLAAGERSMRALVGAVTALRVEVADPATLANVNTPAEVRGLRDR